MKISNKGHKEKSGHLSTRKDWDVKRPTDNDVSVVEVGKSEGWL